jgi:tRNA A-37 threonylcarbamoyl transferase component Bud32
MKLHGNSNYSVEIKSNCNGFFVVKKAYNTDDWKRLCRQIHKQQNYFHFIENHKVMRCFFDVPEVIDVDFESKHVEMKFCNGRSVLDIIEQEDIFVLSNVLEELFLFLQWEFDNSKVYISSCKAWDDKVDDLRSKVKDNQILKVLQRLPSDGLNIPIGRCHGDLTFSNMLFSNKIVLLDFLDSFIETPLIDITKLMQEVNLKWSLLMSNRRYDYPKIIIGYNYLQNKFAERLKSFIEENKIHQPTLELFYKMTLVRILPYCKSERIHNIIIEELQ